MTAITIANKDWEIIEDVTDALTAATIDGDAVFAAVRVTSGEPDFEQVQVRESPIVVVQYETSADEPGLDGERNCQIDLTVHLAVQVEGDDGIDESDRIKEILRLVNAAKNAVHAGLPSDALAVGSDGDDYARKIDWGEPEIEATENKPWAFASIALSFGYRLASATAH